MLCPDCQVACPGGEICPQCQQRVPERESFGGQGGHYLRVLIAFSLVLQILFVLAISGEPGVWATLRYLLETGWVWLCVAGFLIPIVVGLYYWFMLREEEVIVTDDYIARHSRWGNERLDWEDVRAYRCEPLARRRMRVGRIAWLGRLFRKHKLIVEQPNLVCELVGPPTASGEPYHLRLESATIGDMPWLLRLIEERLGPPQVLA